MTAICATLAFLYVVFITAKIAKRNIDNTHELNMHQSGFQQEVVSMREFDGCPEEEHPSEFVYTVDRIIWRKKD